MERKKEQIETENLFKQITSDELMRSFLNYQQKIDILSHISEHKNIIVANFLNDETRKKVMKWEQKPSKGLSSASFNMTNLYQARIGCKTF